MNLTFPSYFTFPKHYKQIITLLLTVMLPKSRPQTAPWPSGDNVRLSRVRISFIPCEICGLRIGIGGNSFSEYSRFILSQGSSTRGPRASFVRPGKGISQNTMRYEY